MQPLDDNTYDVFIVDAREDKENALHLELAVTSGAHKGEVVVVRASSMQRDAIDLIGLPATLIVRDGVPRVTFD
jgi:hypothetical protein